MEEEGGELELEFDFEKFFGTIEPLNFSSVFSTSPSLTATKEVIAGSDIIPRGICC